MTDRLPWFRCFPSALLGALAGLQADEGFVYTVALMRIYETGGPVIETARTLARRTGMTERRAAKALQELVTLGKLTILPTGQIDAESTHDEIEWQHGMRSNNSAAGKSSAAKRAGKIQRNQRNASTSVEQSFNHKREENREEYSETTSLHTQRARKHEWPSDYRDQVWALYPKHAEKKDGMAALDALHRADKLPFETIRAGIERFAAHLSDPQYAPALHRWLKKERWNDEYPPSGTAPPTRGQPQPPRRSAQATFLDIANEAHNELTARRSNNDRPFDSLDGEILGPDTPRPTARRAHLAVYERPGSEAWDRNEEGYPGRARAFG